MSDVCKILTGGCLCGQVRYEVSGDPDYAGHCYCSDCRKASGAGFIPFMGFSANAARITGKTLTYRSIAANGAEAARNSCPVCGSLVFGGVVGEDESHTIYAGSLDDPAAFHPTIAIFTAYAPSWAAIPPHLKVFPRAPP